MSLVARFDGKIVPHDVSDEEHFKHMWPLRRIYHFYNQHIRKSRALQLRKKYLNKVEGTDWLQCCEFINIYSKMEPCEYSPDFSETEEMLGRGRLIPRTCNQINQEAVGVIVETRRLDCLGYVIENFIQQTELHVQIFHGTGNLQHILDSEIGSYVDTGKVTLSEISTETINASQYNAIFLSKSFWNAMVGRNKIFVFQADSYVCKSAKYPLDRFLHFDYIGSKWSRKRPMGHILDGGSGGLSIRDWHKSVECLSLFPPKLWNGGEDGYFAFHIELIGGKVGKNTDCGKFSTQNFFSHKSYGAHGIFRLSPRQREKFLKYCPEAEFLFK